MTREIVISDATKEKDGSEWAIQAPFNAQFRDELKTRIPPRERRWDPTRNSWVVANEWMEVAEEVIVKYFPPEEFEVSWYE